MKKIRIKTNLFLLLLSVLIIAAGCGLTFGMGIYIRKQSLTTTTTKSVSLSPFQFSSDSSDTYNLYPWSYYDANDTLPITADEYNNLSQKAYGEILEFIQIQESDLYNTTKTQQDLYDTLTESVGKFKTTDSKEESIWFILENVKLPGTDDSLYCIMDSNYAVISFYTRSLTHEQSVDDVWERLNWAFRSETNGDTTGYDETNSLFETVTDTQLLNGYNKYVFALDAVFIDFGSPTLYSYAPYDEYTKVTLPSDSRILIDRDILVIPYVNTSDRMIFILYDPDSLEYCGFHIQN